MLLVRGPAIVAIADHLRYTHREQAAHAEPARYLVLDATRPADEISREIQDDIRDRLPDPVPPSAEAVTGSFPAITEPGRTSASQQ